MANVVITPDGSGPVTVEVTASALARVSFETTETRDTVKQVRILTAAVITIVEGAQPPVPGGPFDAFVSAQLDAMNKAIAILRT
jgi:hypothetical protein